MQPSTLVPLAHKHFPNPEGSPVILLHGLLGSSRNWLTVGRELAKEYDVYALDFRNHGDSPHTDSMDYEVLVNDVLAWMNTHSIAQAHFVGHSLGGKTAMALSCRHPQRVHRLVIADIAPKNNPAMLKEFEAMENLDLESLTSRSDAETQLQAQIPSLGMRRFLLTNLERTAEGSFRWSVNLPALTRALATLALNPLDSFEHFDGEALFIRGSKSDFVPDSIWKTTINYFPRAQLITLENAGHNVHVDARDAFVGAVQDFLHP